MNHQALSTFTIDHRDMQPVTDWKGGQVQRNHWTKSFSGDFAGTSVLEAIMAGLEGGSARVYVAIERLEGVLLGRRGSFVLMHAATSHGSAASLSLTIVPGSGTDELQGLSGSGEITPEHALRLHVDLPATP